MRFLGLFAILAMLIGPARGADIAQTAQDAAAMIASARDRLAEARSARDQVKALVGALRAYEVALVAMQGGLREIRSATDQAQQRFTERRDHVEAALVALQAIEKSSPALRMWHPGGALASARAGMIMSDLIPSLSGEADALRAELAGLATLAALQEAAEASMRDARADVVQGVDALKRAMAEGRTAAPQSEARQRRLDELSRNASELGALADGLAALGPVDLSDLRSAPEPGTLEWPVPGEILRAFGEKDASGTERPGLILSAPAASLILAPVAAEVGYAGPFLDQGSVIILELTQEYLLVLAGLGQVFVTTGDVVSSGAPLGLLGPNNTSDEEFLIRQSEADSAFRNESLYIELRENGIAVDPLGWFVPRG